MTSLNDTLFRLAPAEVDGLTAQWEFDTGGDWIEVKGWFSPGLKLGETRYEVPFKHRMPFKHSAHAHEAAMRECVGAIVSEVTARLVPAKRPRGRPPKQRVAA